MPGCLTKPGILFRIKNYPFFPAVYMKKLKPLLVFMVSFANSVLCASNEEKHLHSWQTQDTLQQTQQEYENSQIQQIQQYLNEPGSVQHVLGTLSSQRREQILNEVGIERLKKISDFPFFKIKVLLSADLCKNMCCILDVPYLEELKTFSDRAFTHLIQYEFMMHYSELLKCLNPQQKKCILQLDEYCLRSLLYCRFIDKERPEIEEIKAILDFLVYLGDEEVEKISDNPHLPCLFSCTPEELEKLKYYTGEQILQVMSFGLENIKWVLTFTAEERHKFFSFSPAQRGVIVHGREIIFEKFLKDVEQEVRQEIDEGRCSYHDLLPRCAQVRSKKSAEFARRSLQLLTFEEINHCKNFSVEKFGSFLCCKLDETELSEHFGKLRINQKD